MVTPMEAVKYYQDAIDYIGEQIKQPVQMVHRRTYEEMNSLLKKGEVNIAFICSGPYVKAQDSFGLELLVAPSVNGSARYRSYIIVHKDSPVNDFAGLRGKVFAFTDPESNTGKVYPAYLLKSMGFTPETYFRRFLYSYSHNKSVEMVAKKIADGAAVQDIVYEYMLKTGSPYAQQTKIIKRSPYYGTPPVVVTTNIEPALKKRIKDAFLGMHKTQQGRAILNAMMIDKFVEGSDRNYDTIREMMRTLTDRKNMAASPAHRNTVHFGVIPRDNPRIMYEKYQPLLDYLAAKTPYAYELVLKKTYEETINAIGAGEMDLALLGPLTYLEAQRKHGATCLLKPRGADGTSAYGSVIVVRKDSPWKSVAELKGKSIAFASLKSTSGNLMPRLLLAELGIHLQDLGLYTQFDYQDSVIKVVLKGQYAAGAVRDSVARKYAKLGIQTIAASPSIPTGPVVAGPRTPLPIREAITRALLDLNPRESGNEAMLKRLDEELRNGFGEATDQDYWDIRKKINAVPQGCGRGCHPRIIR